MAPKQSDSESEKVYFTEEEVAKHNTKQDCWIIVGNDTNGGPKVYDVTSYLDDHPGGCEVILDVAGKDADDMFEDIGHSKDARQTLKSFYKGELRVSEEAKQARQQQQGEMKEKKGGLNPLAVVVLLVAIAVGLLFWK